MRKKQLITFLYFLEAFTLTYTKIETPILFRLITGGSGVVINTAEEPSTQRMKAKVMAVSSILANTYINFTLC